VSIAVVLLSIPVVIDVLVDRGLEEHIPVPVAILLAFLVLLGVSGLWPNNATRILFLAGGGVLAFIYGVALLDADPTLNGEAGFVLNRPLLVLVLVGGGLRRPLVGFMWALFGYWVACGIGLATALWAGVPFAPGWGPTMALGIYSSAYLALALIHQSQSRNVPDLSKLEEDTRRMALESQFEQRAAAIVHDTVLNDLSVVMNASGTIDDRARDRLRADVATLADPSWLRESATPEAVGAQDARLRNAMITLVSDFQWRGLTVDVANDTYDSPVMLPPATETLVMAAIAACLENVLKHAGTSHAELIVSSEEGAVTAMVVDDGIGFDPEAVAPDRLGIRASVVARIESLGGTVRIFSSPGQGTSVFMRIPYQAEAL
jgi:signal transduction histidine kinase